MDRTLVKLQLNLRRQQPLLVLLISCKRDVLPCRPVQHVLMSGHVEMANDVHAWATEGASAFKCVCWDGTEFQQ